MSTNADCKILICGKSLLLTAIACHLEVAPGLEVRIASGAAHTTGSDFVPDVIVVEKDRTVPTAMPGAALTLLAQGADKSVILLDPESSALTVFSSHTVAVSSLSDVAARIHEARWQHEAQVVTKSIGQAAIRSSVPKGEQHP